MAVRRSLTSYCAVSLLIAVASALTACGSSSSSSSSSTATTAAPKAASATLPLTISESGSTAKYTLPAQVKGGLVTMQLTNSGKTPHGAQLIRIVGNHTPLQALQILGGQSNKTPLWVHAEGGIGGVGPGSTGAATLNLPAGKYIVVDVGAGQGGNGPPAYSPLTVIPGTAGALPSTPVTITATAPSKDHYRWNVSGTVQAGVNQITFVSKGKNTLHQLTVVRITGNPTKARIIKDLNSNGPSPPYADQSSVRSTAVLDGGKSLGGRLQLTKPGKYILFCHLSDRDGGKPHFQEGLLTTITVK